MSFIGNAMASMMSARDGAPLALGRSRGRPAAIAGRRGFSSVLMMLLAGAGLAALSIVALFGLLLYGSVLEL